MHKRTWLPRNSKRAPSSLLALAMVITLAACTLPWQGGGPPELLAASQNEQATGGTGMVAATMAKPAIEAGVQALQRGGSAADAALTTALAQVALQPGNWVTYAGILTMLYYHAPEGKLYSLNAAYNTPRAELDPLSIPAMGSGMPSGRATLVPGFMAGVDAAHGRFGRLPFKDLFQPAIGFAEEGFVLDAFMASLIEDHEAVLTRLPETAQIFTKEEGRLYGEGDLFRQPQLTDTLRAVAEQGADYMYVGPWAERFVSAVQREGGTITMDDMADYQVIWSEPARTTYRGYEIAAPAPPAHGGVDVVEAFNLLELADLAQYGRYDESPQALFWLQQISRNPGVLSSFSADELASSLPGRDLSLMSRLGKDTSAWLWQQMQQGDFAFFTKPVAPAPQHSAAVVAVDQWGNVAALVHSINALWWGETGIFVDGVSIPDSAAHQQAGMVRAGPGNRLPDPTNPLIVLRAGRPVLASASIGNVLRETVLRLVNVLDYGLDPKAALEAPTLMSVERREPRFVERVAKGDFDLALLDEVGAMGQRVEEMSPTAENLVMARGYWVGITIDPETGILTGAAPLIFQGGAAGY